ncbi:4'-phosphopantetheinyl transferase family protein [Brevibacillus porteri]|uniref:4'-phosphopantetheinyl transferase family protein n=1 Tax=Brevibacillus porteri TaxID=2126350 RepID=UPI003D19B3FB
MSEASVMLYAVNWANNIKSLQQQFQQLLKAVDKQKRERICSYKREEDAFRSLIGNLLIRYVVNRHFGWALCDIHLSQNEYGKPMLPHADHVQFNISHSGEWVVAAIGDREVGVDIEQVLGLDLDVAEYAFTPEEIRCLSAQKPDEQLREFYRIWTRKESFVKAMGKGLLIPVQSFSVITDHGTAGILMNGIARPEWSLRTYEVPGDYIMTICAKGDCLPNEVSFLNSERLIQPFI